MVYKHTHNNKINTHTRRGRMRRRRRRARNYGVQAHTGLGGSRRSKGP